MNNRNQAASERQASAGRSFLLYWKPKFADEFIANGRRLEHIGSKQFRRVLPHDELWIVTARGGALFLVGHFRVTACTDSETVRYRFPHDEV